MRYPFGRHIARDPRKQVLITARSKQKALLDDPSRMSQILEKKKLQAARVAASDR